MTTYYYEPEHRKKIKLAEGIHSRTFWGKSMLVGVVDLEPHAKIPSHSHPQEQLGFVVEGQVTFTIGEETKVCKQGDIYIIPSNMPHTASVGGDTVQLVEVFSPPREDLKYDD